MSIKKRTYINSDEELVVQGKLTVEGEFVQKDTTVIESQTLFEGDTLVVNSDGSAGTARIVLQSANSNAVISFVDGGNIEFSQPISSATSNALLTAQNFSITGDGTAPAVSFDGTAPVALNLTLVNTGVSATTYGAANTVPQFTVNTKGLLTSASDILIDIESSQISDFTQSVRDSVSASTGVTYSNATGVFSIGQPVETDSNVTFDRILAQGISVNATNNFITLDENGFSVSSTDGAGNSSVLSVDETQMIFSTTGNSIQSVVGDITLTSTGDYAVVIGGNSVLNTAGDFTIVSGGEFALVTSNFIVDAGGNVTSNGTIVADSFVGNVTGQVSDISNHTTDELLEGNSNLYYTDGRVQDAVDSYLVGGDGIDYANGTIDVDSTVVRTTGTQTIDGAKTFIQDVEIQGNLNVTANINSRTQTDLYVEDTSITLANGSLSNVDAYIYVDGLYANKPNLRWDSTGMRWEFTNDGVTYHVLPITTEDLPEQLNLYYTTDRANSAMDAYLASITANVDSVNGQTGVVILDTDDVAEGSNLYYTDQRVEDYLSGNTGIDYANGVISVDSTVVRTQGDYALEGELSFAANASLKIPTGELLEENAIYVSGSEVFAYVGNVARKLTPAVDVGDVETVGATGVEIYAGTRVETSGNTNVTYAGIRRLDSGNSILVTEASNVITVAANIASIREQFSSATSGLGSLSYNSATGVFTYAGPDSATIRGLFSGTGLINYNSSTGEISTTADNYNSWTLSTESNVDHSVVSGETVTIQGGTNITVTNSGNVITIANDNDADITAVIAGTGLTGGGVQGNVTLDVDLGDFTTDDLAEGNANLYYTVARANNAIDARVDSTYINTLTIDAANVMYDNSTSGLSANSTQTAIDELSATKLSTSALTAAVTFFPTTANSNISGYARLVTTTSDSDYNTVAANVNTGTFTGTDNLVGSLVSDAGVLEGNTTPINITTVGNVRRVTGNDNDSAEFYFEVYKRDSIGTETLIGTSFATPAVSDSAYKEFYAAALIADTEFTSTDRLVLKFYASVVDGGGGITYDFQYGGNTPVRSLFPVPVTVVPQVNDAEDIIVDATGFSGLLSTADDDVQSALTTLDSTTTDDVPEGNSNVYYTDARARLAISEGTGVTYSNATGVISIGQAVETDSNVTFDTVSLQGLSLSANVGGKLNTVAINENGFSMLVEDTNNVTSTAYQFLDNGFSVTGTGNATFSFSNFAVLGNGQVTANSFVGNLTGNVTGDVTGQVSDISNHSTDDLAEGANLYYTDTRARNSVSADSSTGIDYNVTTGQFFLSNVPNDSITNSSITVNGVTFDLGESNTITANTTQTLTRGTYLTGSNFNGGTATTWAVDATPTNVASKVVARDVNGSFSANVITATATQARYADLAENYQADRDYPPGTVLIIGGSAEVTTTDKYCDTRVAGVVSTDPAHLMNSKLKDGHVVAVALRGRVPVKVMGPVHKGDVLVASDKPGYACAAPDPVHVPSTAVVGKALSNHSSSGSGIVEVMV